jgi:hypothetical protein
MTRNVCLVPVYAYDLLQDTGVSTILFCEIKSLVRAINKLKYILP